MRIGHVSDERYVALPDVLVELERDGECVAVTRTGPRGGIDLELEPGTYRVTLAKDGYGAKSVEVALGAGSAPYAFRLLSHRMLGYAWPKWVRSGAKSEFRCHSIEPYRLSLWRYGWKKELVRPLGWFDEHGPLATMQVTPDGDYTQTGVEWNRRGYGSPHHTQLATAPERSGLYYFRMEGESGAEFAFPWIVAPAVPTSPVAVLASTNTWNAYNHFGGRSNYLHASGLPPTPVVNARLELRRYRGGSYPEWQSPDAEYRPLSFERPEPFNHIPARVEVTDPIEGRQACHLAPAEWRLLGWLEREGFPYDFYSEYQLHAGELNLDAYRVLILSTHPEYWSREMYRRVKDWVFERGGRLMYLAGNGLNCEIELPDEQSMRCLSHLPGHPTGVGLRDPGDAAARIDSRFARTYESEARLLGVVFTETGIMTAAPYQVLAEDHWAFAGTGLRSGDPFGVASLHERIPGGASGHETDERSPNSPANAIVLARGMNPENGGGEMVIHQPPGGGAVFSVGSITYPACLLVDPPLSRVTRNVLERFLDPAEPA